jgi:hypothetical protein
MMNRTMSYSIKTQSSGLMLLSETIILLCTHVEICEAQQYCVYSILCSRIVHLSLLETIC